MPGRPSPARGWPPAGRLAAIATLAVAAAFFAVPIVWLVLQSSNAVVRPWSFGSFGQIAHTWHRIFASNWIGGDTLLWLANSTLYSAAGAAIAVALCVPAGYGLAATEFAGRRLLLAITMVVMLIPANALVLPLFLEANAVHLLSSPLAVILPFGLFPFGVFLAYLYFDTPAVHHLLTAARVDGCDEWQAFRRVAVPLATPVAVLIALLDFVAGWTNYFLPWVMYGATTTTGRYPVALGIAAELIPGQSSGSYLGNLQLTTTAPPAEIALLILVTSAPVLAVFVLAQRWIGAGRLRGVFG